MAQRHVGDRIALFRAGRLSREEAAAVDEHLRDCEFCRRERQEADSGEGLLQRLTRQDAPDDLWPVLEASLNRRPSLPVWRMAAAFAALATAGAIALSLRPEPALPGWEVRRVEGEPELGGRRLRGETGELRQGQRLVTDAGSRAALSVGDIGHVQVEPDSRLRLVDAGRNQHRVQLERGKLSAFIWAPPGQFYVDTPSAVAIDLGCAYTLEVSTGGNSLLDVTSGWVAFEWQGRESFVPAGARCITRPGLGPGTPFYKETPPDWQQALCRLDERRAQPKDLPYVLAAATQKDALTLWHMISTSAHDERGRIFDRLAELVPPPAGVTRDGILLGRRDLLDAWWNQLGLGDTRWWRHWKGPLPGSPQ